MNQMLLYVIVTGAWIALSAVFGFYLSRKGQPYKPAIIIIHGLISLFIIGGTISSIFGLQEVKDGKLFSSIAIYSMAVAVLIKIVSGLVIAFMKTSQPALLRWHKIGTYLIVVSLAASIIFLIVKV